MLQMHMSAGETIYKEGDEADAVYLIEDGAVEVSRIAANKAVRLAVFGKGEIFGESGVIHDKPRSTTMRALMDCQVLKVPKEQFFTMFGDNNPMGLPLLKMLTERLEKMDERLLSGGKIKRHRALLAKVGAIRILPMTDHLGRQIGDDGISLSELPFRIGRRPVRSDAPILSNTMLLLHSTHDQGLSPDHLELEKRDGYLIARDLGSHLGTIVNGEHLSRFGYEATAGLYMGINDVIAGPKDSPFRFRIMVEEGVKR